MPRWICVACSGEFWGWGVYYRYKAGERVVCPDCEGRLVKWDEKMDEEDVASVLSGTAGL